MKKKIIWLIILIFVIIVFVFGYIYYKNESMVPVLGYHGILPAELNDGNELIIDADVFEKQLIALRDMGYKTLTLDEYYCWKMKKCDIPHRSVLITFDDGYQNNYEYAFPLLKKYNMNAVVFYIGEYAETEKSGFINLETIKQSKEEYPNIEFASHSFKRHNSIAENYEEVDYDIKQMKNIIDTKYFAYPHGEYTEEYIDALKDNGYVMAFTFGPGKEHRKSLVNDDNYKIPRLNISNSMPMWKFKLRLLLPM
ncbi:MAG: polysaccharide deacetylase family protein [Bacilli bacterium]|nr:polysaccharide deacetylase family protein [Bacilli bacterium]